jgi:hypothetical protein
MPQYSYDFENAILGQLATYEPEGIDSLLNELPKQVNTVTTGGTATDGTYRITVVGEEGTFVAEFVRGAGETNAQITDALAAAWLANTSAANVATMTSDGVSVNTIAFLHAGQGYTVSVEAPAPGTLTNALVTDPAGSSLPLGIALASDDGEIGRLPAGGDTAQDIYGIVVRNADLVQELSQTQPTVLEFLPGSAMSVLRQGEAWVVATTAINVNDGVFVALGTGADAAGTLRGSADGGNTVQLSGRFRTAGAAGELVRVLLNTP